MDKSVGMSQNNLDWVGHVTLKWFFSPNYDWFCGFELSILELILTFVTEEFDKKNPIDHFKLPRT